MKREAAVAKEMNSKLSDDKKISRKEKDERILWKKNEVAEYESTTFSIFYNNVLFLSVLILCSFYIFAGHSPAVNYIASMGLGSGIVALLSTGSGKYWNHFHDFLISVKSKKKKERNTTNFF